MKPRWGFRGCLRNNVYEQPHTDGGLLQICGVVAAVKGWGMMKTAQRMLDSLFEALMLAFYAGQLSQQDV